MSQIWGPNPITGNRSYCYKLLEEEEEKSGVCVQQKGQLRPQKQGGLLQDKEKGLSKINPASTLIFNFQASRTKKEILRRQIVPASF